MRSLTLLVCVLAVLFVPALTESPGEAVDDFLDSIKNIDLFRIRRSALACPVPIVGQKCPDENPLFYFKCCGDLASSCCFRLQDWVMALMIVLAVCIVISIVVNFIRCLCCY